jgi:hypothetical protein
MIGCMGVHGALDKSMGMVDTWVWLGFRNFVLFCVLQPLLVLSLGMCSRILRKSSMLSTHPSTRFEVILHVVASLLQPDRIPVSVSPRVDSVC